MNTFISELKNDHVKLLNILQQAQELGLAKESGRKKLLECKQLLTEHLRKEDSRLYPELKKAADQQAMKTAGDFSQEMKGLTRGILDFINKAERAELGLEYAKELGRIISTVRMRIRREEIQLYPLYENIAGR